MSDESLILAASSLVAVMGRIERTKEGALRMGFPGVTLRVAFEGTSLGMRAHSSSSNGRFLARVDDGEPRSITLPAGPSSVSLTAGLARGPHRVDLVRQTEASQGVVTVFGFEIEPGARPLAPAPFPDRRILVLGDSVTCGVGVDHTHDCSDPALAANAYFSYGMVLARALDAQCQLVCYGGRGLVRDWQGRTDVRNAPQFLELAVPDDEAPPAYDLSTYPADAVIVSLGINDFTLTLPDFPSEERYVSAYVALVRRLQAACPHAHVFLTEGSMVNDEADPSRPQKSRLRRAIERTVEQLGDARVRAVPARYYPGLPCDAHPTRAQHAAMARDLEPEIRRALGW